MAVKKTSNAASTKRAAPKQQKAAGRDDYGAPIDPWFEQFRPEQRTPLERLRRLVDEAVPDAESGLKWGVPFWTLDGRQLCDLAALKRQAALGIFAPPEVFDDPRGQLQGTSPEYRVLKVKYGDEIDAASVTRWLRAAAAAT